MAESMCWVRLREVSPVQLNSGHQYRRRGVGHQGGHSRVGNSEAAAGLGCCAPELEGCLRPGATLLPRWWRQSGHPWGDAVTIWVVGQAPATALGTRACPIGRILEHPFCNVWQRAMEIPAQPV